MSDEKKATFDFGVRVESIDGKRVRLQTTVYDVRAKQTHDVGETQTLEAGDTLVTYKGFEPKQVEFDWNAVERLVRWFNALTGRPMQIIEDDYRLARKLYIALSGHVPKWLQDRLKSYERASNTRVDAVTEALSAAFDSVEVNTIDLASGDVLVDVALDTESAVTEEQIKDIGVKPEAFRCRATDDNRHRTYFTIHIPTQDDE